jgi:hypothetical protein
MMMRGDERENNAQFASPENAFALFTAGCLTILLCESHTSAEKKTKQKVLAYEMCAATLKIVIKCAHINNKYRHKPKKSVIKLLNNNQHSADIYCAELFMSFCGGESETHAIVEAHSTANSFPL